MDEELSLGLKMFLVEIIIAAIIFGIFFLIFGWEKIIEGVIKE